MKDIKHVLFVCTGNSCRSVMAAAYLKKKLQENNILGEVESAGTLSIEGLPATTETFEVLKEEGIRLDRHESKRITKDLLDWADVVLVMEPAHRSRILFIAPEASDKVRYLSEFNKLNGERIIPDPIGQTLAFYRRTFNLIKHSVEGFTKWLEE